jgi:hypothetical protein
MKLLLTSALFLFFAFFISCKSENAEEETAETTSTVNTIADTVNKSTTSIPVSANPTLPALQLPQAVTAVPTNTTEGLNPAHGQPGHRCDIEVGAPLNSKPEPTMIQPTITPTVKPTTNPAATVSPLPSLQVNPTANNNAVTATAKGLNPAHGQPGHRCDIAVGAPLDSKPAAKTTTPVTTSTQTIPPAITTTSTMPNKTTVMPLPGAPGLNPKHGEPGHRCDIAVGAPLNSEPKKGN